MSDLAKRLRIKAGMIEMGELIEWGSDSALMREAADALELTAPAVQEEPVVWSLRFRHGDKYERVGPVNYMTTFGSKEDADIYANRVARDLDGNPEPERRPVVVPLYVAPPAAQKPEPDVAQLVEVTAAALDEIEKIMQEAYNSAYPVCCGRPGSECCGSPEPEWSEFDQNTMDRLAPHQRALTAALSAYRKGGDES